MFYSDFPSSFDSHPDTQDLAILANNRAISQSLKNILLTTRGERVFDPRFGCNIRSLLFENDSPQMVFVLKETIVDAVKNYEKRIVLGDIDVLFTDQNLNITLYYNIRRTNTLHNLQITVSRQR